MSSCDCATLRTESQGFCGLEECPFYQSLPMQHPSFVCYCSDETEETDKCSALIYRSICPSDPEVHLSYKIWRERESEANAPHPCSCGIAPAHMVPSHGVRGCALSCHCEDGSCLMILEPGACPSNPDRAAAVPLPGFWDEEASMQPCYTPPSELYAEQEAAEAAEAAEAHDERWVGVNWGHGAPGDLGWQLEDRSTKLTALRMQEERVLMAEVDVLARALICRRDFYYGMTHDEIKKKIIATGIPRFYEILITEDRMTEEDVEWMKCVVKRDENVVNEIAFLRSVPTVEQYKKAGEMAMAAAYEKRASGGDDRSCRMVADMVFEEELFRI